MRPRFPNTNFRYHGHEVHTKPDHGTLILHLDYNISQSLDTMAPRLISPNFDRYDEIAPPPRAASHRHWGGMFAHSSAQSLCCNLLFASPCQIIILGSSIQVGSNADLQLRYSAHGLQTNTVIRRADRHMRQSCLASGLSLGYV